MATGILDRGMSRQSAGAEGARRGRSGPPRRAREGGIVIAERLLHLSTGQAAMRQNIKRQNIKREENWVVADSRSGDKSPPRAGIVTDSPSKY